MTEEWPAAALVKGTAAPRYAGFWLRFAAYVIDIVLLSIVEAVLAIGVLVMVPHDTRALANVLPVSSAIAWAYFAVFESSPLRATVGKYALGLYVSDLRGDPIGFGRATARYWLKLVSNLTLLVGWIMAGFTPRKQALHDMLAGTLVLRRAAETALAPDASAANLDDYWDGSRWVSPATLPSEG